MSALAIIAAGGFLTALTTAGVRIALGRGAEQLDQLTPTGYDPAPADGDDLPAIRVNPGRDPL